MANKLDRNQIESLKAEGLSVRKIAERLSEMNGTKVSPSSVHYMLSKENGNGESKTSPESVQAILARDMDSVQVRLDELKAQLDRIESTVHCLWLDSLSFRVKNLINRILNHGMVLKGNMWVRYGGSRKEGRLQ